MAHRAGELVHRPHEAAGVKEKSNADSASSRRAVELVHRPDKPAGVGIPVRLATLVVLGILNSSGFPSDLDLELCEPTARR